MKRRLLLATASASVLTWAAAGTAIAQPRHLVSAAALQDAVAQRFPRRFAIAGVLELTVRTPVLRLLPRDNRVASDMIVDISGPAVAAPATGEFDVDFMLRYERSDRSIRASRLRVRALRVAGLPAPYPEVLDGLRQAMAQQTLGEVVLHRLQASDLALPESLGLEPDSITVTADGLVIGFAPAVR